MSLHEVTPVGSAQLMELLPAWVSVASAGLALTDDARLYWERSLAGLVQVGSTALERFARYVVLTREAVIDEGYPIVEALGYALPSLQLPRDPAAFAGIKDRSRRHPSAWRREFVGLRRKRHPYLLKQNPNQIVISEAELRDAYEKARDVIPVLVHPVVELFIESRPGWNSSSEALANCQWEHVKPLFEGLAREKTNLGQDTQRFYEEGPPDLLSADDVEYLELLVKRKTTGAPEEEDVAFYERHRDEIREDRKLKSSCGAWDHRIWPAAGRSHNGAVTTDWPPCGLRVNGRGSRSSGPAGHRAAAQAPRARGPPPAPPLAPDHLAFAIGFVLARLILAKGK